jgi:hypothetical protein
MGFGSLMELAFGHLGTEVGLGVMSPRTGIMQMVVETMFMEPRSIRTWLGVGVGVDAT